VVATRWRDLRSRPLARIDGDVAEIAFDVLVEQLLDSLREDAKAAAWGDAGPRWVCATFGDAR